VRCKRDSPAIDKTSQGTLNSSARMPIPHSATLNLPLKKTRYTMPKTKSPLQNPTAFGQRLKRLKVTPLTTQAPAAPPSCQLLSRQLVDSALIAAINARYNTTVTDTTSLQGADGLNLDSVAITTDFYGLVVMTVHDQGCRIRHLSPQTVAGCDTVGDVVDKVWADLSAPAGT
jgi:hypothetical protein